LTVCCDRAAIAGEGFAHDLNATGAAEWIDQYSLLELRLGFARGMKVLGEIKVLLIWNPSANPTSVRAEFDWLVRMWILVLIV
jgi:hypothetical protein